MRRNNAAKRHMKFAMIALLDAISPLPFPVEQLFWNKVAILPKGERKKAAEVGGLATEDRLASAIDNTAAQHMPSYICGELFEQPYVQVSMQEVHENMVQEQGPVIEEQGI
jgi:hypothetical protein